MKMNEYAALQELLAAWNLSELFEHFQAENINIVELKMMKFHHIELALHLFSLGTRIRFEHHLQQWRQSLHKPLQCVTASAASCHCKCGDATMRTCDLQHVAATSHNTTEKRSITPPSDLMHEPFVAVTELESDVDLGQNNITNNNNNNEDLLEPIEEQVSLNISAKRNSERARLNKEKQNNNNKPPVSVKHILTHSGPKGLELFNWPKNEPLMNTQRTLLVHLIASYFGEHNLHLTLHASHILERELLKLFPREKLSSYRTGKRGKIYIKFTNLKRYKKSSKSPRLENARRAKNLSDVDIHQNISNEPMVTIENSQEEEAETLLDTQIKIEEDY